MNQLNLFIELTRIKKPIGFMLLFWPCIWGLTLVYDFNSSLNNYFFFGSLFLAGSIFNVLSSASQSSTYICFIGNSSKSRIDN